MIRIKPDLYFVRGIPFITSVFLPETIPVGFLQGWSLKSQLRRFDDDTRIGLIAELVADWQDPAEAVQINLSYPDTEDWPICIAEFDVLLTASNGQAIRTEKVVLSIQSGVTKHG